MAFLLVVKAITQSRGACICRLAARWPRLLSSFQVASTFHTKPFAGYAE